MTIRRIFAFALVATLGFFVVACGGGGGKSTATSTPKKTSAAAQTPGSTAEANATADATTASNATSDGGNGDSTPGEASTPRPTVPRVTGETTTYGVEFTVASDPGNLQELIESRSRPITRLIVTVGNGQVSFDAPRPFVKVVGTIDSAGNFTASGNSTVDPYENVDVTFTGTITADGNITGTYSYGTNGALPGGQPISYSVTGSTLIPTTPGA